MSEKNQQAFRFIVEKIVKHPGIFRDETMMFNKGTKTYS